MELGMNLGYLRRIRNSQEKRPLEEAALLCRNAGFAYVDYTPNCLLDNWKEQAERDREILDAAGLKTEQTHVPFNRYGSYDDRDFEEIVRRAFEVSGIIGARYIVVHADEYRTVDHYDAKEIEDFEYESLAPHVEYAAKHGMVTAIENLFEDAPHTCVPIDGKSRFTSRIDELQGIVERFHSPMVGVCWDFGHARCSFNNDQLEAMKQVGKYIVCTHVHDNYYQKDLHLMPFLGDINWEAHMAAMKEFGYQGKLSFEMVYGHIPEIMMKEWLDQLYRVGQILLDMFNA